MNVLAIGAHPDDIEIGCAGVLLQLKKIKNAKLYVLVLTEGKGTFADGDRLKEQEASFKILGVDKHYQETLEDGDIHLLTAIRIIEEVVDEVNPDYIFSHYENDTHQDHRVVAQATRSACRHWNNLLYYESYSAIDFSPGVFADIEETLSKKLECLAAYKSQEAYMQLKENVCAKAIVRSQRTGFSCCEAFVPVKLQLRVKVELV